jgi:phospholipid/cholesterol/gamma-HCH transport system permease protein
VKILHHIGEYLLMLRLVFVKPTKRKVMQKLIFKDIQDLIIGSLGIVAFLSFFVGGVVSIQTALNIENPLIPKNLVGFATRQSVILEFAPTFMSIILAGKVGSFITSSIGTMRVTEQIDALEVMGINSVNYLVFPKIISMLLLPIVINFSMFLGILGGYAATIYGGFSSSADFIEGIQLDFRPYHVVYAFIKTLVFAMVLATIPSYHGYYMKGGRTRSWQSSYSSLCMDVSSYYCAQLFHYSNVTGLMITLNDITKSFDGLQVLKGISMSFEPGKPTLSLVKVVQEKQYCLNVCWVYIK